MLIQELTLRGLLSFGPDTPPFTLTPLNVLIGPNGSGKSNLIEAIGLLRSSARELTRPIRETAGGIAEWIWKGDPSGTAMIDAVVANPHSPLPLRHVLALRNNGFQFEIVDERVENATPYDGHAEPFFYYRYQGGQPFITVGAGERRHLQRDTLTPNESILTQRKDPEQYPVLAHLASAYQDVRIYREWQFGKTSVFRKPQPADLPGDRLEEDFSNLGLFLNHLRSDPRAKRLIREQLRGLYEGLEDFDVRIRAGAVELFLTEGDFVVPAARLSDGTLRFLCLLAILCDPDPPPLICIEEPELGLHPDMLPKLADLLVEASSRSQLIVTTHSDVLVDALTDHPESVVVVEKRGGKTSLQRLNSDDLAQWLEDYRLGQLWLRGEIGGTRW